MGDYARSSAGALWVTALGVVFAGSQLFIMAMSTSLEAVNSWPVLTIEYSRTSDGFQLTAQNAGNGPALVTSVNWTIEGRTLNSWPEAVAHFGGVQETDLLRWERVSNRVIPPSGIVRMADISKTDAGTKLWESWKKYDAASNFSICYCSALNESWVGRWASQIAGMPSCWTADRRSLRPLPAPGNQCTASTFKN